MNTLCTCAGYIRWRRLCIVTSSPSEFILVRKRHVSVIDKLSLLMLLLPPLPLLLLLPPPLLLMLRIRNILLRDGGDLCS